MTRKEKLRRLFVEYDSAVVNLVRLAASIKEEATPYWQEQGFTVIPRLERLRESVNTPD